MVIKILIIVFLITIVYSLGSALVFLVKDHGEGDRTVKRLTWRISLSLVLLLFLRDLRATAIIATSIPLSVATTSSLSEPCTESYFRRWASVSVSIRSLIPTISMPGRSMAALNTIRPIRPNPLIATLIMRHLPAQRRRTVR